MYCKTKQSNRNYRIGHTKNTLKQDTENFFNRSRYKYIRHLQSKTSTSYDT